MRVPTPCFVLLCLVGIACRRDVPARSTTANVRDAGPPLPEACAPERRLPARRIDRIVARPDLPAPTPALVLTDLPGTTRGSVRAPRRVLYRMDRRARERAFSRLDDGVRVFVTPSLPIAARDARRLRVGLRFGGAGRVEILPRSSNDHPYDRAYRLVTVDLPDQATDAVREIEVDLGSVVRSNWRVGTEAEGDRFESIEIRVDSHAAWVTLDSLVLEDEFAALEGPSGVTPIDRDGTVIRSVFVREGGEYAVRTTVPVDAERLVWYGAAERSATLRIDAVGEAGTETIASRPVADRWTRESIDVSRFAGRTVTFAFSSEGGLGFVGAPSIVRRNGARAPDVVLYLVDLLLATQLGAYGNPRANLSPTIDRIHRDGLAFGRMRSTSPWTKPAVPTLLTGIHPSVHRVGAESMGDRLPPTVETLQRRFGARGHRTGSFAASPLGSTLSGLDEGFDVAVTPAAFDRAIGPMRHPTAAQLHERLLAFLDEEPDRPFFAFVHSLDVHEYKARMFGSGPGPDDRNYDRAIRQQDRALGELLDALRERRRDVLLVLVSDHGEALREFGRFGHGIEPYQSQVVVPLVFHWPGHLPRGTIDDIVSLADVAPTIVDLYSLPAFAEADGSSLLRYALELRPVPVHDFVTSSREWFVFRANEPPWFTAEDGSGNKAVRAGDARSSFDLDRDPCELRPAPPDPAQHGRFDAERERLLARARAFEARHGHASVGDHDADDARRLRALGYAE